MTTTDVLRVALHALSDEYIGTQLAVFGQHDGRPFAVCGGVSDLARVAPGAVDVWLGGVRVRVGPAATVLADAPPQP